MTLEQLRDYLSTKPAAVEDFPFGPEHLVFKVAGKMFALIALEEEPLRVNLKCGRKRRWCSETPFRAFFPDTI